MTTESTDGRLAKGERRRRAILDATARVVERDGVAGVSHRAIAREAGVPPASIAYYFAGIDELLVATLLESVELLVADVARMRADTPEDGRAWARAIAENLAIMINERRARTIAEYELYLLAARRPALRPAARRWIEVAAGEINEGRGGDAGVVKALFAAIDGLLMQALIADEPPVAADFEPALHFLLQPLSYLREAGEVTS
ncbi:TetR family transcriptional regulator [Saccharopolyspora sp. NFXS83]|uniref:TetR/AcrR family transcriptional regulator n=1 Tax=Saccharopolyspora sp. NFXS83 TaxID=2993560 RepID=UPI00224AAB17|nr:TetR family transcriptional regulator [Saccharopolyspora sp. NFXS83]MCX2728633.1 TetR family transcriptional regulator [Saccharopolyspora sp. NFXS83]